MKKFVFLILTLALASCTAAPTQAPEPLLPDPTQTPFVVVETVVVTVIPTNAPTDVPPPTPMPPTDVPPQPTAVPLTQAPAVTADPVSTLMTIDNLLGNGVFTNISLTGDTFTLQCLPREITLTATAVLVDIKEAELFYRMVDQPRALYYSEWKSAGKMKDEGNGVFSILLTGDMVHPNLRLDPGWFEFQLVGLNKGGGVVDRTEKIEQTVTYRINCP